MEKKYIVIWLVLIVVSFIFDKEILLFIQGLKNPLFDYVFLGLHYLSDWITIFILFSLFFLIKKKNLKLFLISYIGAMAVTFILKNAVLRDRPEGFIGDDLDKSFPSGHTTAIFSTIYWINKKIMRYWILIALLVIISRVYLGFHYLSDALAGAFIGYFVSKGIIFIYNKWKR